MALKLRAVNSRISSSGLIVYKLSQIESTVKKDYPGVVNLLALRIDPKMLIPSNLTAGLNSSLLKVPKPTIKKLINER